MPEKTLNGRLNFVVILGSNDGLSHVISRPAPRSSHILKNLELEKRFMMAKNQLLPARLELAIFGLLPEFQAHISYETDALPTEPRKHCPWVC